MKFFKHFTDAHRGTSMQAILNKMGHKGHSAWWILVELCAEKMEKRRDEEFTEEHCKFVFDERFLRDSLRLSGANVAAYLHQYATMALLRCDLVKGEWHLEMPKLLESMDRDTKRTRPGRGQDAPKIKIEIKIEDKEEEGASCDSEKFERSMQFDFQSLFGKYPRFQKKTQSIALMLENIRDKETFDEVSKAIDAYKAHCVNQGTDFQHTLTFPNWWLEWRDWLDPSTGVAASKSNPNWSEMAKRAWSMLQGEAEPDDQLSGLIEQIGRDELLNLHRDDFRQGGRVAGLLKDAAMRAGA